MSIPFVRQYPDGRRGLTEITRGRKVDLMAARFIHAGGRYLCEILPDAKVRLAACLMKGDFQEDVEERIVANDTQLPDAVDELVKASNLHLSLLQ